MAKEESKHKSVVCKDAHVAGDVQFGKGCVVHPFCQVRADKGPVIFGNYNIIEQKVKIVNRREQPMRIGSYNHFEIGAVVDTTNVGDCNNFQPRCALAGGSKVGSNCIISAALIQPEPKSINDSTILFDVGKVKTNYNFNEKAIKETMKSLSETLSKTLPDHNKII